MSVLVNPLKTKKAQLFTNSQAYISKKEKVVSRQPILINLKSNTMKNTVQM